MFRSPRSSLRCEEIDEEMFACQKESQFQPIDTQATLWCGGDRWQYAKEGKEFPPKKAPDVEAKGRNKYERPTSSRLRFWGRRLGEVGGGCIDERCSAAAIHCGKLAVNQVPRLASAASVFVPTAPRNRKNQLSDRMQV